MVIEILEMRGDPGAVEGEGDPSRLARADGETGRQGCGGSPVVKVAVDDILQLGVPPEPNLRPTPQAGEVLFRGSKVFLTQRAAPAVFRPREEGLERSGQQPEDQELMAALKATRLQLARQEEVPLYVIFSNATLADMARRRPQTMEEFLSVSGVGEVKARKYGAAFLAVLARAEKEEV